MLQTEALERARNHGMSKRCIGANQARQVRLIDPTVLHDPLRAGTSKDQGSLE